MKRTVGLIEHDIAKINYAFTHHNNHPKMTIEKQRELMGKLNDLVMEKIGIPQEEFLKEHKLSASEAINS